MPTSRRRGWISNEIRRQLVERDGLRCAYVGCDGQRCTARAFLQIHHKWAWARGGPDTLDNLQFLCGRHNRWLGELEFGERDAATWSPGLGKVPDTS